MGQYKSQYTGPQIDAGINSALNPDLVPTDDSDALITSGGVYDALAGLDPTISSSTPTTLTGLLTGDGVNVGTKSLDTSSLTNDADHVPVSSVVKSAITSLESDLASIHATGTTNTTGATIASGTYFYLNGALVRAKANIAVNATFTNGTNYEAVTAGGLNDLKSVVTNREYVEVTADGSKTWNTLLYELAQLVDFSKVNSQTYFKWIRGNPNDIIATLAYYSSSMIRFACTYWSSVQFQIDAFEVVNSYNCIFERIVINTSFALQNKSNEILDNGQVLRIVY